MKEYKSFEDLKKELGDNYDKVMYDMNLELIEKLKRIQLKIDDMFNRGDENTIIDDLAEIEKIIGDDDLSIKL